MNGVDASTTFTDTAPGGTHAWTASGNAQIDTAQKKFGTGSGLFDGSGDYLTTPYSTDFDFDAGDFTWDFWVRFNALPSSQYVLINVARAVNANNVNVLTLVKSSANYFLYFQAIVGGVTKANYHMTSTWPSLTTGTWYHVALVRSGSSVYIFIGGQSQALTVTTPIGTNSITPAVNQATYIGRAGYYTGYDFKGWLDEVRISKGIARWTSNFTPPTDEYRP
jgi:hypothetical protein